MAGGLHPSNKPLPWHIPTLNSVVRLIVQLSGFFGRKGDGESADKTLRHELLDIAVFVAGVRFARLLL